MSVEYCADLVRDGDPDRFTATLLAPAEQRAALLALYAFNLEIARAPWASAEEMVAMMRLQWWIDSVDDLYGDTPRDHPVMAPLADAVVRYGLPRELLLAMAEARRFDIYRDAHADRQAFDTYIDATSGGLMQLAARILGTAETAMPVVAGFAYGAGVANLWRALPVLYARGRHPVPVDCALDRNAVAEGVVPDNLARSLREISVSALGKVRSARARRREIPRSTLAAMLAVRQIDVPLQRVAKMPETALTDPFETSPFRAKAGILWRSLSGFW